MGRQLKAGANMLAARIAHASVEGSAFIWTQEGFRVFLILHSLAILWALGPKRTISTGVQCAAACSAARFAIVLAGSSKKVRYHYASYSHICDSNATLESIWDFDPPGDLGKSGAWKVLKELARTMAAGVDSHVELQNLDPLPFAEVVTRLVLLYKHIQEHPVTDNIPKEDITGKVTPSDVETLCKYLYFADQSYDCGTEDNLKELLKEHGYDLNFAKLESTWAEHHPAYFLAVQPEEKQLLITVRGTAQVEDVITDLTALPTNFADTDELVHGGIYQSAIWLKDRLLRLSQAMAEAGYSIMIVGHSLGAGAAAMLAMWMKRSGIEKLTCYAFATPNCVSEDLAESCVDYVTSVVFRDDIIARFSPHALAKLHKELQEFDVDKAIEQAEKDDNVVKVLSYVRKWAVDPKEDKASDSPKSQEANDDRNLIADRASSSGSGSEADQEEQMRSYRPHIPGRVLYIYRQNASETTEEEHELAFVKFTCPALRCIRLSDKVITDHLIDSYFGGFGRPNPSKIRAEKQKAAAGEEDAEGSQANGKEMRREQSATERDKEEKSKWQSWKAKLGLVSS